MKWNNSVVFLTVIIFCSIIYQPENVNGVILSDVNANRNPIWEYENGDVYEYVIISFYGLDPQDLNYPPMVLREGWIPGESYYGFPFEPGISYPINLYVRANTEVPTSLQMRLHNDYTNVPEFEQVKTTKGEGYLQDVWFFPVPVTFPNSPGKTEYTFTVTWGSGYSVSDSIIFETSGGSGGLPLLEIGGIIAGLIAIVKFGPVLVSKIGPSNPAPTNTGSYVNPAYPDAVKEEGVVRLEGQKGLPKDIVDGPDSEDYGDRVRVFTVKPPTHQEKIDKITELITDLPPDFKDDLQTENWKKLDRRRKGAIILTINNIAKEALKTNHKFEFFSGAKNLGGEMVTYTNGDIKVRLNINGSDFDHPLTTIRTIIHEIRHVEQLKMKNPNGTPFERALHTNDIKYSSPATDVVRYYQQIVEKDARYFSQNLVNEVLPKLAKGWVS